jgi:hypothetical protein
VSTLDSLTNKLIREKVSGYNCGLMELNMKAFGIKIWLVALVGSYLLMETFTRESGLMIKQVAMESTITPMVLLMLGIGRTIGFMAWAQNGG